MREEYRGERQEKTEGEREGKGKRREGKWERKCEEGVRV